MQTVKPVPMTDIEEPKETPQRGRKKQPSPDKIDSGQNVGSDLFSPRFKSVAAMAGWDEESLLIASLIVEDTPERDLGRRKRSNSRFKSPPSTNSRRKRRVHRRSPIPVSVLNLEEEEPTRQVNEEKNKEKAEVIVDTNEEKAVIKERNKEKAEKPDVPSSSSVLPCLDKLREELSCAICLEICYEPSTTSCGHSFCKKCLRSAADKCGRKCPKCRQLISNGRSCTVNTVLWNTIQLLFPQEVEARKATAASTSHIPENKASLESRPHGISTRRRSIDEQGRNRSQSQIVDDLAQLVRRHQTTTTSSSRRGEPTRAVGNNDNDRSRRGGTPSQDEDAALALRLQREELMVTYRGSHYYEPSAGRSVTLARTNLRAMASRALNVRMRNRPV